MFIYDLYPTLNRLIFTVNKLHQTLCILQKVIGKTNLVLHSAFSL